MRYPFLLSPLKFLASKKFPETFFSLPFQTTYSYSSKCRHKKIYFSSLKITIGEKNVGFTVFLLITHCSLFREKEDGKPLKQNILIKPKNHLGNYAPFNILFYFSLNSQDINYDL